MSSVTIMAIKLSKRRNEAIAMQETLTKYGCLIKMRLGLHEAGEFCSEEGIILLQLVGSKKEIAVFTGELKKKCKVKVNVMEIK
jgi:hypothetical protein